jgi:hypothetical protein
MNIRSAEPLEVLHARFYPSGFDSCGFDGLDEVPQKRDIMVIDELNPIFRAREVALHAAAKLLGSFAMFGHRHRLFKMPFMNRGVWVCRERNVLLSGRPVVKFFATAVTIPHSIRAMRFHQFRVPISLRTSQNDSQRFDVRSGTEPIEVLCFAGCERCRNASERCSHRLIGICAAPHAGRHFRAADRVLQFRSVGRENLLCIFLERLGRSR